MEHLISATRGGALAIAQTKSVITMLKDANPNLDVEIKTITTTGDDDRRTALWNLKDTGFFTSQIEDALLEKKADFAVHSYKDLPTKQKQGLTISAVCDREFAEDCVLSNYKVDSIEQLPEGAKIGTSSLRRAVQVKHLRSDLQIEPIRGNVKTRINKVKKGDYDAIILARAGLERLALQKEITFIFNPIEFVPAPAQGALAIQIRKNDKKTNELIAAINNQKAQIETSAERRILTILECGCHAPVGAFAKILGQKIKIIAFISDLEGKNLIIRERIGKKEDSLSISENLAKELLSSGGREILKNI